MNKSIFRRVAMIRGSQGRENFELLNLTKMENGFSVLALCL